MNYYSTSKGLEEAQDQSPRLPQSAKATGWHDLEDASRGRRRMRLDTHGRVTNYVDATGTALKFTHDDEGHLRRIAQIAQGDGEQDGWFADMTPEPRKGGFSVRDALGQTRFHVEQSGRVRKIKRNGERLAFELDDQHRIVRVKLPGSGAALRYDWDEEGECAIRVEGGETLIDLGFVGAARRISLDKHTWFDETVSPLSARFAIGLNDSVEETLTLRLNDRFAIEERVWGDGTQDYYLRDEDHRLTQWQSRNAAGDEHRTVDQWSFAKGHIISDTHGAREVDAGGRVLSSHGGAKRYEYDEAGKRTFHIDKRIGKSRRSQYQYDPLGNLTSVTLPDGRIRSYSVDGMGRRTQVLLDGVCERNEHRDETGRLWAVTDAKGRPLHVYIWLGDRILARIDGKVGEPLAEVYLTDPFGTPNGALVASGDGWDFERIVASPYGCSQSAVRPTLYGHFADPLTGLIHAGAREIDPELGVFLSPDPWHGGEDDTRRWGGAPDEMIAAEQEKPHEGFHDYALCRFDPLGRVERDGHVSAGDVFLHILRWILLPTWGFPLTSISLFFFLPLNLYMEVVGLIIWAIKQGCDDKSHPWQYNTIAGSTGMLFSLRQFTFAFGLNGFLPKVITGGRPLTVGNVIWLDRGELNWLARPEGILVEEIDGAGPLLPFNTTPGKKSVLGLEGKNDDGEAYLHFSTWTRGFGNTVDATGGRQQFKDVNLGPGPATSILMLRQPAPEAMSAPHSNDDDEELSVSEFLHSPGDPVGTVKLPGAAALFALQVPNDTRFAQGDWIKISAPEANPKVEPNFTFIRDKIPAHDRTTLILDERLTADFQTNAKGKDLRIDGVRIASGAQASGNWQQKVGAPIVIERSIPPGPLPADFPPSLEKDKIVHIKAVTPDPGEPASGTLAAGPARDTQYAAVKKITAVLTLEPDAGGLTVGDELRLRLPKGGVFRGTVEAIASPNTIKLDTPHPDVEEGGLLVLTKGADRLCVRVTSDPANHVITVDPPLPLSMASADGARIDVQHTRDSAGDEDKAEVTAIADNLVTVSLQRARLFAPGNFVRFEAGGVDHLRYVSALTKIEIELSQEPKGSGLFTIKAAVTKPDRSRKGVSLAPNERILEYDRGALPSTMGDWGSGAVIGIVPTGFSAQFEEEARNFYVNWAGARPANVSEDYHRSYSVISEGAKEYIVLVDPLPLKQEGRFDYWQPNVNAYDDQGLVKLNRINPARKFEIRKFSSAGVGAAKRDDRSSTGRVLAFEPEALVPDDPRVHDTHRRALIEHEIHHTVQTNYWGPLMGALPLQFVVTTIGDINAASGDQIPDWVARLDDGPIEGINFWEIASIGGLMQIFWKYVFLGPFHANPELSDAISDLNFDDFNRVVNPVTALLQEQLPQIDPDADPGERWLAALGRLLSNGLDLRSWFPGLGFFPLLLPDGPRNFIEQGSSRASGELYSTIVTANDRFNVTTSSRINLFPSNSRDADLHVGIGRPVRLLMFQGGTSDRVLSGSSSNLPNNVTTYRDGYTEALPISLRLPKVGATVMLPDDLYHVQKRLLGSRRRTFEFEGPRPAPRAARPKLKFVEAEEGDTIVPKLRALVPMPPTVNRTLGCYFIAGSPVEIEAGYKPGTPNSAHTNMATLTIGDKVYIDAAPIPWTPPRETSPSSRAYNVELFETERSILKIKHPKDMTGPEFEDIGITNLELDFEAPSTSSLKIKTTELPDKDGWEIRMPSGVPTGPPEKWVQMRMRIYRIIKKDDAQFDLQFDDVPTLAGVRSYLDTPIFTIIRDADITVKPLPDQGDVEQDWDDPFELTLPIKLERGASAITIVPPAGFSAPDVERLDHAGPKDKWRISALDEAPPKDAEFQVTVSYGLAGSPVEKRFKLTFKAEI